MSLAGNNDANSFVSNEAWAFESFMERNLEKELLRFTTAGSVDDGKSTLIGRLLLRFQISVRGSTRRRKK